MCRLLRPIKDDTSRTSIKPHFPKTGSNKCLSFQVECQLFPDMRGQKLLLRSVKIDEALVADYVDKSMEIFKLNTTGPQKYVQCCLSFS
ncbi:hypothetical protein DPMN_030188 [Dreissena polymorpha]|uniref:Uncharacterized protein n=1 Tax=Dreissena polymorpha TaxID=45954 RepID=A0A9D4M0F7_DREPO|nr:hypothetical protein DPMN_030188 [Dreissena polymorpha]